MSLWALRCASITTAHFSDGGTNQLAAVWCETADPKIWQYGISMGAVKVTFTLDSGTIQRLNIAADRLAIPKSEVVREAIAEFYERLGRLSERERTALLKAFDELVPQIETRSSEEVDQELAEVRRARRSGGRRSKGNGFKA